VSFRTLPTITGDYRHPSCELLGFRSGAGDVYVLLGQRAASLGINRLGTRYNNLQELKSNLDTHKLQYKADWMQIRHNVNTYLLLNFPMSSPITRLAKDFQYRRQLPCGSFETEPTKQPEFRDNYASLIVAKCSSFFLLDTD